MVLQKKGSKGALNPLCKNLFGDKVLKGPFNPTGKA